jgi:hypothetical protein
MRKVDGSTGTLLLARFPRGVRRRDCRQRFVSNLHRSCRELLWLAYFIRIPTRQQMDGFQAQARRTVGVMSGMVFPTSFERTTASISLDLKAGAAALVAALAIHLERPLNRASFRERRQDHGNICSTRNS